MAVKLYRLVLLLLALSTLCFSQAWAEDVPLRDAHSHKFLDRQNLTAFAILGSLIALDAVHTQIALESHRFVEGDPLARPFVTHGWPGQLEGSALGFGTSVSLSYVLHGTNHHKIERWTSWLIIGAEAAIDTRNSLLTPPPLKPASPH
jgi:hypothetical protein